MTGIARRALLPLLLLGVAASAVKAQTKSDNRLHVLRIDPGGPAEPTDSVIVTFDRPVAPELDHTVDPAGVVRITPAAAHTAYWRDPSSLVVVFDQPWSFGATYRVDVVPTLRSADGRRFAANDLGTVHVRAARALAVWPTARADGRPATMQRPRVVLEAALASRGLAGKSWLVPLRCAGSRDSIPLRVESISPLDPIEAGKLGRRDHVVPALDSLRRVVQLVAEGELPRACLFGVSLQYDGIARNPADHLTLVQTAPPFRIDSVSVSPLYPSVGHIALTFSAPITESELQRTVRVNGHETRAAPPHYQPTSGLFASGGRFTWIVADSLAPGARAEVTIERDLRDLDGEALGRDERRTVVRPHAAPSVSYMTGLVVVPRDARALLVVSHVNTDSIAIDIARVPDSLRAAVLEPRRWFQPDEWKKWRGDTVHRAIAVASTLDSTGTVEIPTSLLPDAWRDDPVLMIRAHPIVGARYRALAGQPASSVLHAVVQRTNLAVHLSAYAGRAEVWVTSLRSAEPVRNARVRVLGAHGATIASATTDARGRARVDLRGASDMWPLLEVSAGGDRVFSQLFGVTYGLPRVRILLPGQKQDALYDDDDVNGGYEEDSPRAIEGGVQLHGAAFSERGIYRPGEHVFLHGVVRTFEPYGKWATPAGDSVRWTISWLGDPYGWKQKLDVVQRRALVLTSFGSAVDTFDIPRSAALGAYRATLALRTPIGWRTAATTQFSVAEYRPTEFELQLASDTTRRLFAGDTARVRASARYLFGMPMTGRMVHWSATVTEGQPPIAGIRALEGFRVGRPWWRIPDGERIQPVFTRSDSALLDAAGTVAIALPATTPWPTGAMQVVVSATDASRQAVTAQRTITVHGADAYVGMRTRSTRWYWNAGDTVPVELMVTRVDGSTRAGTNVALAALRYAWRDNFWRADTVWRGAARSASQPVLAPFTPPSPGWYELLATARDERGRPTTTGLSLWVAGPASRTIASERREIDISLDQTRFAPGDTITAVLSAPVAQRAWISLTRTAPLDERVVALRAGPNVVRIPVPMEAIPRAELRVVGVSALGSALSDRDSYISYASRTIEVSAKARELAVQIVPERSRYAPGEPVRVRVHVADARGRGMRAETTIWAVDQGVGLLTGLEKPDLLGTLLGTNVISAWQRSTLDGSVLGLPRAPDDRSVQVRIRGMSSRSARRMSGMYLEETVVTAYREARVASVRRLFSTTPLFTSGVVTDSAGFAETSFTLPDNVTTYRLFATAVSQGVEAGSGDTSLVSTRPLLVRAALPRVVRLGDSLVAGGVLTQDAEGTTPISLRVETRGIEVLGAATRSDTLRDRVARELRFPMKVTAGDSVMVRLRGGSASAQDAVELTLPVSAAGHPRAHVVSGTMQGKADVALPVVEGIDVARSRVKVQLGSSVLPLVRQLSDALRAYPYGCTEQLTSAGRALLARLALERVTNPAAPLGDAERRQLESIVSRIVARQLPDGGFGYWDTDSWTSPWLTAYAAELLLDARAEGISVPESVTDQVAQYLGLKALHAMEAWTSRVREASSAHDLLAMARVLRRLGQPNAPVEVALETRRDRLGFVDRLDLARLRAMSGDSSDARRLLDGAWKAAHLSGQKVALDDSTRGEGWLFASRLRPLALLARTTAELQPAHPLLGALVESIVQRGRAERDWQWNTLDQSATADALAATRSIYGFGARRSVTVASTTATLAKIDVEAGHADSVAFSLATLVPPTRPDSTPRLALAAESATPIFYAATLFETPRARPVRADDEGISVERWYEGYDDRKPTTSVREGQLVRVRLRITVNGDRDFVAVEDPLPAGLEAVDLNLRTSAALQPPAWARNAGDDRVGARGYQGWWSPWEHTEMRDDRVLYFARMLGRGSWDISYVARATTAGRFVRPPAHAEEMYNPAVHGRSDGGWFTVTQASDR
jgi:uncharacterized protein YfaS (alpha-2-macroglobulin family)